MCDPSSFSSVGPAAPTTSPARSCDGAGPGAVSARRRSRARRDQILEGARTCFRQAGFHGASMSSIARQAGLSVGQIYRDFANKEALIEAAAVVEVEMAFRRIEAALTKPVGRGALISNIETALEELAALARHGLFHETSAEAARNGRLALALEAVYAQRRTRLEALIQNISPRSASAGDFNARLDAICLMIEGCHSQLARDPDRSLRSFAPILGRLILSAD